MRTAESFLAAIAFNGQEFTLQRPGSSYTKTAVLLYRDRVHRVQSSRAFYIQIAVIVCKVRGFYIQVPDLRTHSSRSLDRKVGIIVYRGYDLRYQ